MVGQFVRLRGPFPLPPSGDYTQCDDAEEERRGLGDLVITAADLGGHEKISVEAV